MSHEPNHQNQPAHPDNQAEFVVGAVVGALAGAAAALLLTPKNGQEMRGLVKQYAKEWEGEAYELAKEARGVSKSLQQALGESADHLVSSAPQTISQASQGAQQLAGNLEQHLVAAKDVVSEIAEAFKSGWEEYGEELKPEAPSAPVATKIEVPAVMAITESSLEVVDQQAQDAAPLDQVDQADQDDSPLPNPVAASTARRRSPQSHHYAMHGSSPADQPQADPEVRPMLASEEVAVDQFATTEDDAPALEAKSAYTTRVIEEVAPVKTSKSQPAKQAEDVKEAEPVSRSVDIKVEDQAKSSGKKLFFRRK